VPRGIAAAPKRTPSVEIVAAEAKGFTVGAMMNANAVYVFFDPSARTAPTCGRPRCPCTRRPFVWIPVGLINADQFQPGRGPAVRRRPGQTMTEHEKSLLAGQGGIGASASVTDAMPRSPVKPPTPNLFNNLGLEGVPFTIVKQRAHRPTVTRGGSMDTAALAELIGVDAP
jgi:thiol:disulfide interchange protein DsbG